MTRWPASCASVSCWTASAGAANGGSGSCHAAAVGAAPAMAAAARRGSPPGGPAPAPRTGDPAHATPRRSGPPPRWLRPSRWPRPPLPPPDASPDGRLSEPDGRLPGSTADRQRYLPDDAEYHTIRGRPQGNRRVPLIVSWANGYLLDCLTVSEAHNMPDGADTSQAVMAIFRLFRGLEC